VAARALVFDLDGTIWDSFPWLARVIGDGDKAAGRAALASLRRGVPAARLLRQAGVSAPRFASICDEAVNLDLYPAVLSTLRQLEGDELPLGVVTNLPAWISRPMLSCLGLNGFFDSIVDYGRTTRHKPQPDPLLLAVSELGTEAHPKVWYVGDSATDAVAAVSAGLSFAWASYGYGTEEPEGTDVVINSFVDVVDL
jgi:phosphoglycolate phosphatase-like HAD superfamily hydrolase